MISNKGEQNSESGFAGETTSRDDDMGAEQKITRDILGLDHAADATLLF